MRFWVLSAGPNLFTSFHIIGGQFDTVYFEGDCLLGGGKNAFDSSSGSPQAPGLEVARTGFVELTFPETGHYTVIGHTLLDAERNALGAVEATE